GRRGARASLSPSGREQAGGTARVPSGRKQYIVRDVELHPTARLDELEACARYVARLPLSPAKHRELLERLAQPGADHCDGPRGAMTALHEALSGASADPDNAAYASIQRRMELAYPPTDTPAPKLVRAAAGRERLVTSPPVARSSMVARRGSRGILWRWLRWSAASRRT